jgi:hypothetical protein
VRYCGLGVSISTVYPLLHPEEHLQNTTVVLYGTALHNAQYEEAWLNFRGSVAKTRHFSSNVLPFHAYIFIRKISYCCKRKSRNLFLRIVVHFAIIVKRKE